MVVVPIFSRTGPKSSLPYLPSSEDRRVVLFLFTIALFNPASSPFLFSLRNKVARFLGRFFSRWLIGESPPFFFSRFSRSVLVLF